MKIVEPFDQQTLEAISRVLGDTEKGLTGSEINHFLDTCEIPNVAPLATKWVRIYNAFAEYQNKNQNGNGVIGFIHNAMKPVRYTDRKDIFEWRREKLNYALSFVGLELGNDGKLRRVVKATNIDEALKRANRLKAKLEERNVHQDVLKFCRAELVEENYFHAVLEATKSIADKIREKSGLKNDGADLVTGAFALGRDVNPILAINNLITETEQGEQRAFLNLLIGLFGMFRNPTAHEPKIKWNVSEEDALDILTIASLVHRKLDKAYSCRSYRSI